MSHYIFPAADVIAAAQERFLQYLYRFDNSLIKVSVEKWILEFDAQVKKDLLAENRAKRQLAAQLKKMRNDDLVKIALEPYLRRIFMSVVNSDLNSRLKWTTYQQDGGLDGETYCTLMETLFDGWNESERRRQREHFQTHVVKDMEASLQEWLDGVVGDDTWKIWYAKWIGRDLHLEKGEDYRVMDWTRRMEAGEWEESKATQVDSVKTEWEQANQVSMDLAKKHQKLMVLDMVNRLVGYDVVEVKPDASLPSGLVSQIMPDLIAHLTFPKGQVRPSRN